jgi:excisionase family DNA binding protein
MINNMEKAILQVLEKQGERLIRIENLLSASKTVLNLDEVCMLTGLSKSHIYKLTCYKKIPFYKQAKHLFFDRIEIENWLKSSRHATSEELEKQASTYVTLNRKGNRG